MSLPFLCLALRSQSYAIRATIDDRDVIIIYGNTGELHETAFKFGSTSIPSANVVSGTQSLKTETINSTCLVIQYTTSGQTVVEVGSNILLYILGEGFSFTET